MNKRQLHHLWTQTRHIKWWYFLIIAAIFGVTCLFALRSNSEHMARLRDTVYAADKNNGDVQAALTNLQAYVTSHMNTSLNTGKAAVYPPIQLQYTYQRLVAQQAAQPTVNNDDLYTQAQAYCQSQNSTDFSGRNRVPCIQQFVKDHGVNTSLGTAVSPSLYQFDFVSPKWSPDLAGWTLVLTVTFLIIAAAVFGFNHWLKIRAN